MRKESGDGKREIEKRSADIGEERERKMREEIGRESERKRENVCV